MCSIQGILQTKMEYNFGRNMYYRNLIILIIIIIIINLYISDGERLPDNRSVMTVTDNDI